MYFDGRKFCLADMSWIFLWNWTFIVLQIEKFTSKNDKNLCNGLKVPCSSSILPNWQFSKDTCTNICYWKQNKKAAISSIVNDTFSTNIHGMTQWTPKSRNYAHQSTKWGFSKKVLQRQNIFLFPYFLFTCYNHLRTKLEKILFACIEYAKYLYTVRLYKLVQYIWYIFQVSSSAIYISAVLGTETKWKRAVHEKSIDHEKLYFGLRIYFSVCTR